MATRTIAVRLKAETADFTRQLKSASKSLEDVAAKSDKTGKVAETRLGRLAQHAQLQQQQWSTVSTALIGVGVAAGAAVGVAVKKFADFDEAMSSVQAATHESAANMELLRSAAISAGADTQYSATEAAGAIEELAKAGISTADILSGGLAGALNLAAAGGMEVGQAAEIAATALTQFNLKGSDVGHVADLLAAGAGKAQGEVSDLGMALKQGGLVASQTGLSIEETTGTLTAFAKAGLVGSDAGTSFKSMLQRLTPQSAEAQKLMDQLGISAYDAGGNFIGMAAFAGNLQDSLKGLTTEQRNSAMATIFGADAVRAAGILYDQGADGISNWISQVDDAGYAAITAAARTDNLKGDVERLGGSLETVFIKGGSGANGALRGLVQTAEDAVDAFGRLPEPVQQGALWLTALAAAGAGVVGIGMKVVTSAMEMTTSLRDLGIISETTSGRLGKAGKAAGKFAGSAAIFVGIAAAADKMFSAFHPSKVEGVEATTKALLKLDDVKLDGLFENIYGVDDFSESLDQMLNSGFEDRVNRFASDINQSFMGGFWSDSYGDVGKQFDAMDESLANLVSGGNADKASEIFSQIAAKAKEQGYSVEELKTLFPEYAEALDGAANSQELQGDATSEATGAIQDQTQALNDLLDAQKEAAGIAMSVDEAQGAWAQQIDDNAEAVKKLTGYTDEAGNAVAGLGTAVTDSKDSWDLHTEAGRLANSTMLDTSSKAWSLIDALKAQNASEGDLRASMQTSRDEFILTATQMGMNESAAKALADRYGLIPERVTTTVNAVTDDAKRKIDAVIAQIANLPLHKTVTVEALTYATTYAQTIYSASGPSGSGNALHRASGGPIVGPGTGTSDDILMWASNGEHMATAFEVDRAGGQSAWYALRAAVRRDGADAVRRAVGAPGYAAGGAVPREARVTPSYYSQPNVSVAAPSMEGLALTGSLNVNGVLVPLVDARIERQQKRFARGPR